MLLRQCRINYDCLGTNNYLTNNNVKCEERLFIL